MRFLNQIAVFSSALLLTAGSVALAAPPAGQQPGGHLKITEVVVDFDADTLTITGESFDFNDITDLEVTLGDATSGAGPGDITGLCDDDITAPTATKIECDISSVVLPAGDYLLTVATGAGQSQSDEYDLTIGAPGSSLGHEVVFGTLDTTLAPGQVRAVFATCPAGKVVTGGGGSSHRVGVSLFDTEPDHINSRERTTWVAQFINDTASDITVTLHTYAICVTDN